VICDLRPGHLGGDDAVDPRIQLRLVRIARLLTCRVRVRVGLGEEVAQLADGRAVDTKIELGLTFGGEQTAPDDLGKRRVCVKLTLVGGARCGLRVDGSTAVT
jgi:hypothetical protein